MGTHILETSPARGKSPQASFPAAVLVCDRAEWAAVRKIFPAADCNRTPFGEYFVENMVLPGGSSLLVPVFYGGWGKTAAAASTQYLIDRFAPGLLVNLGTCGGFEGAIERGTVILAERTVIYDIIGRMGDVEEDILRYTTILDPAWLVEPPMDVVRGTLVSADQDLDPAAVAGLREKYGAAAADWESGAIAYTAARNGTRLLILRGVTDLVGAGGGEAYDKIEVFHAGAESVMKRLFDALPAWLEAAKLR